MQPLVHSQKPLFPSDYADISSPYRQPLLRLLQKAVHRRLFDQDDIESIKEAARSSFYSFRLHSFAFSLWLSTTDSEMKSELDAFFCQEDEAFQNRLIGSIQSDIKYRREDELIKLVNLNESFLIRVLTKPTDEEPHGLDTSTLVKFLKAIVTSSLADLVKESFYSRFIPHLQNPDEVICGVIIRCQLIICYDHFYQEACAKASFYPPYHQKMKEIVLEYLERARFLQPLTLPFEDQPFQRAYFVRLLAEQPHHYTFWLLAHLTESEWDVMLKIHDNRSYSNEKNFLSDAMSHAALLGGTSPEHIQLLQNFYMHVTFVIKGSKERLSSWGAFSYAQPKQRVIYELTEGDIKFAQNLSPEGLALYLLSLKSDFRTHIKYHLNKKDPNKLLAALTRAMEMNHSSLPKFLECLQNFPQLFMRYLFDEPFKLIHLVCLAKCDQNLFGIGHHTTQDLTRVDRVIEWVKYLSEHPEIVVSRNFFKGFCETGFWELLKVRILEADHEPSKDYIRIALPETTSTATSLYESIEVPK